MGYMRPWEKEEGEEGEGKGGGWKRRRTRGRKRGTEREEERNTNRSKKINCIGTVWLEHLSNMGKGQGSVPKKFIDN